MMDIGEFKREWLIKGKVDFDHKFLHQCVDLVRQYFYQMFGLGDNAGGVEGAIDYWKSTPAGILTKFDKVSSSTQPREGDVVVLYGVGSNIYGHIGIATGAINGSSFEMLEQNGGTGGGSGLGTDAIRTRYIPRSRIAGILRPKQSAPVDAAPAPALQMPAGEFHNMPRGMSFWALEAAWGLPHGTLNQLNPTVNPRTIQVGQQIRIRPAAEQAPTPQSHEEFYTIRKGDTFWGLEEQWGLPHGTLNQLNPTVNPRSLRIGSEIRVKGQLPVLTTASPHVPVVIDEASHVEPAKLETVALPATSTTTPPANSIILQAEPQDFTPRVKVEAGKQPGWFQRHFSADKVLKDISALATWLSASIIFIVDHYTLIAWLLTALGGIIFGENRFKLKK